jgi:hypothetical protein
VTERPILFKGRLVRAILAGRKTQTRRLVAARDIDRMETMPDDENRVSCLHARACGGFCDYACGAVFFDERGHLAEQQTGTAPPWSPYGVPGDRLWVRETWCLADAESEPEAWRPRRADGRFAYYCATDTNVESDEERRDGSQRSPWKPSIHMPRWASRLLLEVTEVRVQRLQAITEEDAKAEGAGERIAPGGDLAGAFDHVPGPVGYRNHFRDLWDSINAERAPWASNPWVWAVTFKEAPRG